MKCIDTKITSANDVKIQLHHIVSPSIQDPQDMGLYCDVIRSFNLTHLASYSLHGVNVTVLNSDEHNVHISVECFHDIIKVTPNLQELIFICHLCLVLN